MTKTYRRNNNVTEKTVDDAVFLAHPETGGLYQMNTTGRALWAILETGTTLKEAVKTLTSAFPNEDPASIAEDVGTILADMEQNDLIA